MRQGKDPRINVGNASIREYIVLFWVLAAFNGFHMWLYQEFLSRGLLETNVRFVINFLMGYLALAAAGITGLIAFVRHVSWNRPMRKLSEAAREIAKGDFSVRISPLRKDGKKDYMEVMFDDFNTMARELQSIETMKNDFIANVSHEIKTPLAIIQGYAAAMQNNELTAETRHEYINNIMEASGRLSALVSNILKINKLENERILCESHPFDLGEQLRRCVLAFEDIWENKKIRFETELEETNILCDENLLEIVWNNLISNAIKFTNPGGCIGIKLKTHDVYTGAKYAKSRHAQVSIKDSGCGMDEETQKHIFDKFYQADTSRAQEGNGLGLAMVKRAVDLLGGEITVESRKGEGSCFTVILKA